MHQVNPASLEGTHIWGNPEPAPGVQTDHGDHQRHPLRVPEYLAWLYSPAHLKLPEAQSLLLLCHALCPGTTFEICGPLSRGRPF